MAEDRQAENDFNSRSCEGATPLPAQLVAFMLDFNSRSCEGATLTYL